MEHLIEAEGLEHRYGTGDNPVLALNGINLTVRPGEYLVVLGPNGSGKSTLAKHCNALLLPSEGQITVAGWDTRDQNHLWDIRRTAGMVFQNPDNQIVASVVEEDVAFGPENLGIEPDEIRRRVNEALETVGMTSYTTRQPHHLSGGQKQRVAIAGLLAMRPRILLLDEPTAMLDPAGRAEVLRTVRRLNRDEGLTLVHITHFMEEAAEADRVVVIDRGKIVLEGTPREVFSRVETLTSVGLDVPLAAQVSGRLRQEGVPLPEGIVTIAELVEALCLLSSKT